MTIHLIVSCVKDKKYCGPNLSDITQGSINDVYNDWVSVLSKYRKNNTCFNAIDIYKGNTWKTNISVFNSIKDDDKKLWIVSCGYGLITGTTKISGYQATFQKNDLGSIFNVIKPDEININLDISKSWWNLLTKNSITNENISSLSELIIKSSKNDKFIFVLSKNYLDAVRDDILNGLKEKNIDFIIISNSKNLNNSNYKSLFPQLLPYIEGASHDFSGNMITLNSQIALSLIKDVFNNYGWNIDKFFNWAKLKGKKNIVKNNKISITDSDVEEFINSILKDKQANSFTGALKILRNKGFSCEQKRFKKIYESLTKKGT